MLFSVVGALIQWFCTRFNFPALFRQFLSHSSQGRSGMLPIWFNINTLSDISLLLFYCKLRNLRTLKSKLFFCQLPAATLICVECPVIYIDICNVQWFYQVILIMFLWLVGWSLSIKKLSMQKCSGTWMLQCRLYFRIVASTLTSLNNFYITDMHSLVDFKYSLQTLLMKLLNLLQMIAIDNFHFTCIQ